MTANNTTRRRRARAGFATLLTAALALPSLAAAQTLVHIDDGDVQGQLNDGTREFLGIPYAAPPVGSLRFSPPAAPTPWVTPLDATEYPPGCSQLPTLTNGDTRIENEDCLYLNVWVPDTVATKPRPVMFWIHGGSNTSGSTADFVPFPGYETSRLYDGHTLAKTGDVIVVTVNYRLNVFGFFGAAELAAEDPLYPHAGNQGLLDQRAAMMWVRDNIAAFGGDPNNVTIFGESAGSFDVCAHVVSPMSQGLFHKAISQSGGCTVGVQSAAKSVEAANIIIEALGCDMAPDKMACLRAVPTDQLLDVGPLVALTDETNLALSVDGGFLTEHPRETFNTMGKTKIPYMMGANSDEGTLFFIGTPELTESEYSAELVTRFGTHAAEIEALYPASNFDTPKKALIRVFGDSSLVCSTYDVGRRYSAAKNKAYAYQFARQPPLAFINFLEIGVFHGLEIGYVFGSVGAPTPVDALLSTVMQGYWTSFARKGKPKVKHAPGWAPFKSKTWKQMRLNAPIAKTEDFRRAECEYWSSLYDTGEF